MEEVEKQTRKRGMTLPEALSPLSWVIWRPGAFWKGIKPVADMAYQEHDGRPPLPWALLGKKQYPEEVGRFSGLRKQNRLSELLREKLPSLTSNWSISRHVTHSRPKRLGEYTPGSKPALLSVWNTATPQVNRLEL